MRVSSEPVVEPLQTCLVYCPYCGEGNALVVDCTVETQEYIEDCTVCCRPMILRARVDQGGVNIVARHENES